MLAAKIGLEAIKELGKEILEKKAESAVEAVSEIHYANPFMPRLPGIFSQFENLTFDPRDIAFARRPEELAKDVAGRMWKDGLTPIAWDNADAAGRIRMLENIQDIISQEMLLSSEHISKISFDVGPLESTECLGVTTAFPIIDGDKILDMEDVHVRVNEALLNGGFDDAVSTLYHEMLHAMQYVSVLEAEPFSENVAIWAKDLVERAPDSYNGRMVPYLTDAMEGYAHAQEKYFLQVFHGYESDYFSDYIDARDALSQEAFDTYREIGIKSMILEDDFLNKMIGGQF